MKKLILKVTFALCLMLMANSQINAQTQPLLFNTVNNDLLTSGWLEVPVPAGFIPEYTNYEAIHYYTKGIDVTIVYDFPSPEEAEKNKEKCHNKWNSGGGLDKNGEPIQPGCYNSGKDCNVELNPNPTPGGDIVVVVCC